MLSTFVIVAGLAFAPSASKTVVLDVGTMTCQQATEFIKTEPAALYAEVHWELGFWSGLNASQAGEVGATMTKESILVEVQKECNNSPSDQLWRAESRVYERYKATGL